MESWDITPESSIKPTDVEREVRQSLLSTETQNKTIPSWNELSDHYEIQK